VYLETRRAAPSPTLPCINPHEASNRFHSRAPSGRQSAANRPHRGAQRVGARVAFDPAGPAVRRRKPLRNNGPRRPAPSAPCPRPRPRAGAVAVAVGRSSWRRRRRGHETSHAAVRLAAASSLSALGLAGRVLIPFAPLLSTALCVARGRGRVASEYPIPFSATPRTRPHARARGAITPSRHHAITPSGGRRVRGPGARRRRCRAQACGQCSGVRGPVYRVLLSAPTPTPTPTPTHLSLPDCTPSPRGSNLHEAL
jgi:hypothetical protein